MSARHTTDGTGIESTRIWPDDPQYRAVVDKRFNKRFSASPDYVRLVSSTDQVVSAVGEAEVAHQTVLLGRIVYYKAVRPPSPPPTAA
ncbi:MAG TPA: hypothetical protein VFL31_03025 [Nitrospiraceae bacterium]|nr:hypothetical protein [Nitrospiraceae bacterium]